MTGSATNKAWFKEPALWMALLFLVLSIVASAPAPAHGIDLYMGGAKAMSNEESGNGTIGGSPTELQWNADVSANEEVSALTLYFPEGTSLTEQPTVTINIYNLGSANPVPLDLGQTYDLDTEGITVEFKTNVVHGQRIQIFVKGFIFPNVAGEYTITGSYLDGEGELQRLDESEPMTIITASVTQGIVDWLGEQEWVKAWNSILFLKIFLNPVSAVASIPYLFIGWLRSLGLVLCGFPLAIPIGLGVSFLRMSRFRVVRFISSIYVNIIRGTPLFLQIYIVLVGLPIGLGVRANPYLLGVLVLALNSSAYLAEIFRAGIQSIHKGQFEASASLGMNGVQTMFSVIIPQTVRRVIPTATSEFILLYKDTSLLAAVGVMEQMMYAKSLVANTAIMTPYVVAAGYYLIVTLPLTRVISVFEKKLAGAEGSAAPPKEKKAKRVGLFTTTDPAAEAGAVGGASGSGADLATVAVADGAAGFNDTDAVDGAGSAPAADGAGSAPATGSAADKQEVQDGA
jgi:polar amino acid transport system substrate-binding protein